MRAVAILVAVVALTACGSRDTPSPESVARAWSAALDRSDHEAAAKLFARSAKVIQDGELVLHTHADAVAWNAALPCGGRITRVIRQAKDQVLVVFRLTERPGHRCDGPGQDAAAVFRVERGKIVLWHQTQVPAEPPAI
jgi:limonene-1,2-epoxide hydrolase